MSEKPVVLISESIYDKGKSIFDSADRIQIKRVPPDEKSLSSKLKSTQAVAAVLGVEKYIDTLYQSMPNNGLIARFGVGYDGIDLHQIKSNNLVLTNTPEVLDTTVAELTVFMAAELLRKSGKYTARMKSGIWNSTPGMDLSGKTWGIIGLGNIGLQLSKILHFGFGVRVIGLKRDLSNAEELKQTYGTSQIFSDFDELAKQADILSLHLPANQHTHHFINNEKLAKMKTDSFLVNTGRGSLVDEIALYNVLHQGKLGGAALDVYENEPYIPMHPEKDFRNLDNVVLTPHIGSYTHECSDRMAKRVLQNIYCFLDGKYEEMDLVVNNSI